VRARWELLIRKAIEGDGLARLGESSRLSGVPSLSEASRLGIESG
jgi:hypothetical protein